MGVLPTRTRATDSIANGQQRGLTGAARQADCMARSVHLSPGVPGARPARFRRFAAGKACAGWARGTPGWAATKWSTGKTCFQQLYDFFFATLAVVISIMPIMNTARFIPRETVNKSYGTLGLDEGDKSPDS